MRPEIKQVVELIKHKDPTSLEEALALLQRTVFSFSMKVCGQRQDAEDTMQEVLLKSVPYLPKFESPKALVVWLYKVAKTHCLMSRRRSRFAPKESLSLDELMPDRQELEQLSGQSEGTPETALLRRETARHLREAVQKVPPAYRLILVLHDMEDLSDTDVAEIMGLRRGTVRVRLHRARLFVREEMARQAKSRGTRSAPRTIAKAGPPRPSDPRSCKALFAELSNYLDDELDEFLCQELEKHMKDCRPCEVFLSSLEQTIERCRKASDDVPDPNRAAKLRQELLSKYQLLMTTIRHGTANTSPAPSGEPTAPKG